MSLEINRPLALPTSPVNTTSPDASSQPCQARQSIQAAKASLKLDFSNLPPLPQRAISTNTLIFTNLQSLDVFRMENLQVLRDAIAKTAPIHSWAPLKSFRRIIVSFFDADAAFQVRGNLDYKSILGPCSRVYYGQSTPISPEDCHLTLPDAGRLFFISPPPSPPAGWQVKLEDAPNKAMHATDLAEALSKLRHQAIFEQSPITPIDKSPSEPSSRNRSRSVTMIFQPEDNGSNTNLPCIAVDSLEDEPEDISPAALGQPTLMANTSRPPLELMDTT